MAVYRPTFKDPKTGEIKFADVWWYDFTFAGRRIRESAKTARKTVAKEAERQRRLDLEKGFNGLADARDERVSSIQKRAEALLEDYNVRKPKSAIFAKYALGHVTRRVGNLMVVDVMDKTALEYQTARLKEGASPKTINEEVSFLLRLLPVAQAGAIRAQLKQQKQLKLKTATRIGKAYSEEEKAELLRAAKERPRSKGIYFATMLAQNAGLHDRELRTLQWGRLSLTKRLITVGETKSDAGTGRTIPMHDELFAAAVEYARWYTERFGTADPDWYVFPFGSPRPLDPTRPQTSFKTAWTTTRNKSNVKGRWHDNRHTFVTDLAENGASDQMIQELAGHVSMTMVKHYSHIRTEAKRRAVGTLVSKKPQKDSVAMKDSSVEFHVKESTKVTLPS